MLFSSRCSIEVRFERAKTNFMMKQQFSKTAILPQKHSMGLLNRGGLIFAAFGSGDFDGT